ncbi:MAG: FKBP-type peptidyl-prolyl cis-trans isomerase [Planctomycetes bacterium]|nr:FKBP-type peptidyl-prolyl cis-trans isomerase [Planctomycetota bacterium]
MKPTALLAVVALTLLTQSCRQLGFQDRPVPVDRDEVVTQDGVRYEEIYVGKGTIAGKGDEVLLDYTVWLADKAGTRVDSTLDRGVPVRVRIGDAFIDGLNTGLMSIQPTGRRRITVPARQAYGATGVEGMIPPNADLVFEVHAIEVKPRTP